MKTEEITKDKAHAKLSASGSSTWLNCPGSVKAQEGFPNKPSKYAEEGTLAHELADLCLKNKKEPGEYIGKTVSCESGDKNLSIIINEEMAKFVKVYTDFVRSHNIENTQLYTETIVNFSNLVPGGFGTVDASVIDYNTGICHIIDLKYGQGVEVLAENNTQAQIYALGFYNELKCLEIIKSFRLHIVQPRKFNISSWDISIEDLIKFGEYTKKIAKIALSDNAERIPGEKQCKWCKANKTCPALEKKVFDTISNDFENLEEKDLETLPKKRIKEILDQKELILLFLNNIENYAYELICKGDKISGWKIVRGKSNRKWVDNAEKTLFEKLGEEAFEKKLINITAGQKKLTKEEIDELTYKPDGKLILAKESDKRTEATNIKDEFDNLEENEELE